MALDIRGEMNIELDGHPIHFMARGDHIVLTLERICTIAIAARALSRLPKVVGKATPSLQLVALFPAVTVNVGQDTVLSVTRRPGYFSPLVRHRLSFENKTLWFRDSFQLLRHYFKQSPPV